MSRPYRPVWIALALTLLTPFPALAETVPRPAGGPPQPELTEKESFMLLFGKGNGAMRLLCLLQRDGVITAASRRRYAERLERFLTESGDSDTDRRNARIGMAFADGRASLCPERVLEQRRR